VRTCLVLLFILLFTSCYDLRELPDRAFVIGIAIDKNDGNIAVTLSTANVEVISERGDPEDMETLVKAEAASLSAALRQLNNSVSRSVFFGHAKLLVLGEELLKDAELLETVLDTLQRNNEVNHRIIVLSAENAGDTLDFEKNKEPLLGFFAVNYFENNYAPVPRMDLETLINKMRTGQTALIPKLNIDGEVSISGAAVTRGFKLLGTLDNNESIGLAWFLGKPAGAIVTAEGASFEVGRSHRSVNFTEKDGKLHCRITLTVTGSLTCARNRNNLTQAFEKEIASAVETTFKKLYNELNTDGFGLRELLHRHNRHLYNRHKDNMPETVITVEVNVNLTDSGTTS